MATLTVQPVVSTGLTPTLAAAAAGGDAFSGAGGRSFLKVANGGGGSITVTINSQQLCSQGFDHDVAVVVGAGVTKDIGPFDPARYQDGNGLIQVTYSGVTTVTVGAFSVPAL